MRTIAVEEAEVGDVLAEPVTNAAGRVLLPQGAKLSQSVLARLPGWGVTAISVEGEDPDAAGAQQLLEDLDFRFSDLEDDELMMQIKAIARGHLRGR